jgi:phage terminase large subunit-like protein
VDSAVTGEGGNRLIVDDPHNAREAESDAIREGCIDWWDNAMSSRMNNQNVDTWMVIGQRTHEDDLFGHIEKTADMSEIVHLVLPNEFDPKRICMTQNPVTKKKWRDPRKVRGTLLSEQRLDRAATKRLRRTMAESKYALQYQQDPKAGGGKIMKREFWQEWEGEAPVCDMVLQVWDTALADTQEADYSAVTEWGVFKHRPVRQNPDTEEIFQDIEQNCLILLGADQWQAPYYELRRIAKRRYFKINPNTVLIEKKVSGISLIQDFRRMKMRVTPVSIDHGGRVKIDMRERAELAAPVLEQGLVYYPKGKKWADDVIDQCAKVPGGTNDDYASTVTMALMWLRRKGEVGLWEDAKQDGTVRLFKRKRKSIYG